MSVSNVTTPNGVRPLIWQQCLDQLKNECDISTQQFEIWILPLHAELTDSSLVLLAPNRFVFDWITEHFLSRIRSIIHQITVDNAIDVELKIGSLTSASSSVSQPFVNESIIHRQKDFVWEDVSHTNLNPTFTFDTFVQGQSNELAKAAAWQVAQNPGKSYNPLFIYGDVGLGKTHLMQAIGNFMLKNTPKASVLYIHSERFVADMVKALQRNAIDDFKHYYRSLSALLIDDVQFFAGKDRSQQEFFHTFNALLDGQQQIVLTSDRYPKELEGLEERLKSRLGWGLNIGIDPPELETRVAILMSKAEHSGVVLSEEVAFFIAERIKSNVRELEGALKRVIANAHFTSQPITLDFTRDALKDLLALQAKLVTIENIQKVVARYYKIKVADLVSKRRNRSITRPRQTAMTLAKTLTDHSLPEIGEAFGGRDHTTVLHACRKIKDLMKTDPILKEDYGILLRLLSA